MTEFRKTGTTDTTESNTNAKAKNSGMEVKRCSAIYVFKACRLYIIRKRKGTRGIISINVNALSNILDRRPSSTSQGFDWLLKNTVGNKTGTPQKQKC